METSDLGLKTRHVFLDTEVYRRFGHNLGHKVLQPLLKHIKADVCTLHITDITISEVTGQIAERAREIASDFNKSAKQLQRWYARHGWTPKPQEPPQVDGDTIGQRASTNFTVQMHMDWNAKIHNATDVSAKGVFESYFRGEPPFDTTESKEFPDAFAVDALDRWCVKNHQTMYVITNDAAMLRAVDRDEGGYIGADTETSTYETDATVSVLVTIVTDEDTIFHIDMLTRDLYLREPYETYK